ncbi:MAG: hypothetical protein LBP35_01605 [Candidatus Ancillula trichonymphae]|nr:hypothetical protein [Candidatus Ancillula trichonymphae]
MAPSESTVVRGAAEIILPLEEIVVGDILLIKAGQKVPVDGGRDSVYAGTINRCGTFQFRTVNVGADAALTNIIKLVEDAQNSVLPIAKLADKVAGVFVPVVITIAVAASTAWYFFNFCDVCAHNFHVCSGCRMSLCARDLQLRSRSWQQLVRARSWAFCSRGR